MRIRILLVVLALLGALSVVCAEEFVEYPQFRYISGLPGGGFGVDSDGHAGFAGALQINIPVGYTPSAGSYMVMGATAANDGGFPTDFSGPGVNGASLFGVGMFGPDHALWIGDMGTGKGNSLETAYQAQFQLLRETEKRPGVAIGVVDWSDLRASTLEDPAGNDGRSFFIVATKEAGTEEHPIYYTLGYGNGRFNDRPFGGISYTINERLKAALEYDGWNPNVGVAWDAYQYRDNMHAVLMLSAVDLDRLQVSLALTRHSKLDWWR